MVAGRTICPCCHQEVATQRDVLVSLDDNTLTFRGTIVRLTGRLADVAYALAERMPMAVSRDMLIQRAWGSEASEAVDINLSVTVSQLRRRLPDGLTISCVYGRGYRLESARALERAA